MTVLREVYKCSVCGNVVEVVYNSVGELVCCNQPMVKLNPKTQDQGLEKHVPVVEESGNGLNIKVGSVEHPMEEKHYIKFIEVLTKDKVLRAELNPGQKPAASFSCIKKSDLIEVREYCNVHGLWNTK